MATESESSVSKTLAKPTELGDALDRDNMLANLRRNMFAENVPRSKIGRFEILERLGAGASGVVFAALDPQLERKVAIKLLRSDVEDGARERLLREAKTLARISHPNIVSVHEAGKFEDRVFLAMEYVEGQTLGAWLRQSSRPWVEVVEVFTQAGRGLAAAHHGGLVHRDFKPENVLLDSKGRVRVADFGLARTAGSTAAASDLMSTLASEELSPEALPLTATGAVVGTPAYMAPEVFAGTDASAASDQFSFGVALFEALYGQRPFTGTSIANLVANIASGTRQEHPEVSLPRWLEQIVDRTLLADATRRFASMDELVAELVRDRRPNRTLIAVGLGAVGLGALVFATQEDPPDPCATAGTELAEVWNEEARREIRVAFEATGYPEASGQFERVRGLLDASVDGWARLSRESCRAEYSDAPPPETITSRRALCLDHVRYSIEASIEAFRGASTVELVSAAPLMANETAHLELCGGDDVVLEALAAPPPPEQREALREVQRELARARSLRSAGRSDEALELSEELLERARGLDYPPAEAEALINIAKTHVELRQTSKAADAFRNGIAAADRGRADRMRVQALSGLARKEADLGRLPEARVALEQAEAAFARTGVAAALYPEELLLAHAWVAQETPDLDLALERFDALAERTRDDPASIEMHVTALNGKGNALLHLRRLAEALRVFESAVSKTEQVLGENHALVGQLLANVGATELKLGHYEEADAALERSLKVRRVYLDADHPQFIKLYNNVAVAAWYREDYPKAAEGFERVAALAAAQRPDHPQLSSALFNQSSVLSRLGRHEEALAVRERLLELRLAEHGEVHHATATIRQALGMSLLELGRPSEAKTQLQTAVDTFRELLEHEHADLLPALVGLAQAHLETSALDAAAEAIANAAAPSKGEGVPPDQHSALNYVTARLLVAQERDLARAKKLGERAKAQALEAGLDGEAEEIAAWLAKYFEAEQP